MSFKTLHAGIEGGATSTKIAVFDEYGKELSRAVGEGTNQWQIGINECIKRLHDLLKNVLLDTKRNSLTTLGVSLSGADDTISQQTICKRLEELKLCDNTIYVSCDTAGSLASVCGRKTGIILICGTGSNCELINYDKAENIRCGGWGDRIGDEASAYWITHRLLKIIFDHLDGLEICKYPIDVTWKALMKFFNVENRMGMLKHLYSEFNKSNFSAFCRHAANLASGSDDDELCKYIFNEAGRLMAKHINAVISRSTDRRIPNEMDIVCVGSLFKSWHLLKDGFDKEFSSNSTLLTTSKITLLRPKTDACIGSAILGAYKAKRNFDVDITKNSDILHIVNWKIK